VLDKHDKAWTADAGGQQKGPASDSPADAQPEQQPADAAAALVALVGAPVPVVPPATAAAPTGEAAPATTTPVVPSGPPLVAVPAATTPAAAATPADASAPAATTAAAAGDALPNAAPAPATTDEPAGPPVATVADPKAQNASTGGGATTGQGNGDAPKGDAHAARHAVDGARAALAGLTPSSGDDAAPAPAPAPAATPTATPAAAPAATTTAPPAPDAPAATPVADAPAPTAPVTAPAAHTAPRAVSAPNPVPVAHAPAALVDLVQVAHDRGAGQARMVLHPESLGGVEVHLRQTSEGIRATVHVHHPEALQVLQNGVGDLRRGLEDRGVTIDQIDLGLAPGNQDQQQQGNGAARGDGGFGTRTGVNGLSGLGDGAADDDNLTTPNATNTRASAGVLVDVMA
jgi:flagellar hook-length control protein FliK